MTTRRPSSSYADEAEVPREPPAPEAPRPVFKLEAPAPRPERSAIEQCLQRLVDELRAGQLEARLLEELRAGRERELGLEPREASPPRRAPIVASSGRFRSTARV